MGLLGLVACARFGGGEQPPAAGGCWGAQPPRLEEMPSRCLPVAFWRRTGCVGLGECLVGARLGGSRPPEWSICVALARNCVEFSALRRGEREIYFKRVTAMLRHRDGISSSPGRPAARTQFSG